MTHPMSLTAFFALLFVGLAVVFGLIVAFAALMGWWIEFRAEEQAGGCQMGKGGE